MIALIVTLAVAAVASGPLPRQLAAGTPHFTMRAPAGWHVMPNDELVNTLGKLKLTERELDAYLSSHKGSVVLVTYAKYLPAERAGLIPKIQVNLRRNPARGFDEFVAMIRRSADAIGTLFRDFQYVDPIAGVRVGGRQAVYFAATFTLETKRAETLRVRTRTYAVPDGERFFQINFTDGPTDDCAALFDELVGTIGFE